MNKCQNLSSHVDALLAAPCSYNVKMHGILQLQLLHFNLFQIHSNSLEGGYAST